MKYVKDQKGQFYFTKKLYPIKQYEIQNVLKMFVDTVPGLTPKDANVFVLTQKQMY